MALEPKSQYKTLSLSCLWYELGMRVARHITESAGYAWVEKVRLIILEMQDMRLFDGTDSGL